MRENIHQVALVRNMISEVPFAWQYDVGQILLPSASDLPVSYEVHFSNEEFHGTAKKQLGTLANGCVIPDEYLQSGQPVFMWIYIPSQDHGETEYKMRMQVKQRSKATDVQPTPQEQSIIDQTIAELNEAVENAEALESEWASMSATAETLPAGSSATASYSEGVLSLGIPKGDKGDTGEKGADGRDGVDGKDGADGKDGKDGKDGLNGQDGQDGADGFSPTAIVSKSGSVATITITDKNGTTTATVSDGSQGQKGDKGDKGDQGEKGDTGATGNGIASIVKTSTSGLVDTYTITYTDDTTTTYTVTNGAGVPSGGTEGQVLVKSSSTDYDTEWSDDVTDLKSAIDGTTDYLTYIKPTQNFADGLTFTPGYINGQGGINNAGATTQEVVTSRFDIVPWHTYKIRIEQPNSLGAPWGAYGCWTSADLFTGRTSLTFSLVDNIQVAEVTLSGSDTLFRTDYIRITTRTYGSSDVKIYLYDITYNNSDIIDMLNNINYGFGDYTYSGIPIDLGKPKYLVHKMPYQPALPSGETMQGIAVYENTLVQGMSSGKLQMLNLGTGAQIALYEANAGHCGTLSFGKAFYDGNSTYPLLYVSSFNEPKTFVFDITDTSCTLVDTFAIPESDAGYCQQSAIDENGDLWVLAHKLSSYESGGGLVLTKWDLSNYTTEDSIKTPTLISKTELPWHPNLQSILCLNGQIFALFGSQSVENTEIYVIRYGDSAFSTIIKDFPTNSSYNVKKAEPEGLAYGIDSTTGKYMLYMATRQNAFYLTIRF